MEKRLCSKHRDREAVLYCSHSQCERFLCEECEQEHNGVSFSGHKSYITKKIETDNVFAGRCETHKDFPQEYLCKTHWELCCSECIKSNGIHYKCIVVPFKNVTMELIQKAFSKAENDYKAKLEELHSLPLDNLETANDIFYQNIEEAKGRIVEYFKKLRALISKKEVELLSKVEELSYENSYTDFITDLAEEDSGIIDEDDTESEFDELKKIKLVRKTGRYKQEMEALDKKFATLLGASTDSIEVMTNLNDSVFQMISAADVNVDRKSVILRIKNTEATVSRISLQWTQLKYKNISYQLEMKGGTNPEPTLLYSGIDTKWAADDLLPDTLYSFRVRPRIDDLYGNWSETTEIRTELLIVPQNFKAEVIGCEKVHVSWSKTNYAISYHLEMRRKSGTSFREIYEGNASEFTKNDLNPDTEYLFRVNAEYEGKKFSEWSKELSVKTLNNKSIQKLSPKYAWRKCPKNVQAKKKYIQSEENPRIATKINTDDWCTILGSSNLESGEIFEYGVKALKTKENNGKNIFIGIAPLNIDQGIDKNFIKCGWYFNCYDSTLYSGPPHNHRGKKHGPRKKEGEYVHMGDSVGVVMDTAKGELSFVVNGVNYGVAYGGIPLDKPLVPCAILYWKGDSVELDTSGAKENVDSSIPIQIVYSENITWDLIKFSWNGIKGALFYQIEIDFSTQQQTTGKYFIIDKAKPKEEHKVRVRCVKENSVSEWSDISRGIGKKESFELSKWKECPNYIENSRNYFVDPSNPRVVIKRDNGIWGIVIGSTPIPLNTVVTWLIKLLKTKNGQCVYVGVAASDVNQNKTSFHEEYGWCFNCGSSTLHSGPPHNYRNKEYGPRKQMGEYVRTGDSVGVVMDTTKGDLSFVMDGVNLGVAFEGIPLDKPLVPCVILSYDGDSAYFRTTTIKENIANNQISIPSSVTAKSITWNSITLTWDAVEGATFYQVEMDGSKFWDASITNTFTKYFLLTDTEYTFRVRTVRGNSVSEWSDVVKGKTEKISDFKECIWEECSDDVDHRMKYFVDKENPRIAKMAGEWNCTIIGNTPLPLNTVTSWSIKIINSRWSNGDGIYVGVMPFDADTDDDYNYGICGWHIHCYYSALYSGPPQNYKGKQYGPRKENGQYVHTGDSVGVVMDTAKGELSFVLDGVNFGVAYKGIPLDKPLMPCVILKNKNDSVELVIQ